MSGSTPPLKESECSNLPATTTSLEPPNPFDRASSPPPEAGLENGTGKALVVADDKKLNHRSAKFSVLGFGTFAASLFVSIAMAHTQWFSVGSCSLPPTATSNDRWETACNFSIAWLIFGIFCTILGFLSTIVFVIVAVDNKHQNRLFTALFDSQDCPAVVEKVDKMLRVLSIKFAITATICFCCCLSSYVIPPSNFVLGVLIPTPFQLQISNSYRIVDPILTGLGMILSLAVMFVQVHKYKSKAPRQPKAQQQKQYEVPGYHQFPNSSQFSSPFPGAPPLQQQNPFPVEQQHFSNLQPQVMGNPDGFPYR